jgi:ATP-dependent DNA helicase RecG
MSIEVVQITSTQLNQILLAEESHFLDLKSIDVQPGKLCKFISGFANADGGELYIGIDENTVGDKKIRSWRGFADQESANGHLQVFEQPFPLGDGYSYTFLSSEGFPGRVLQVTILKSRGVVEASDGIPYLRRGAQTLPIKTEKALERLRLDKGIESFERRTIEVELEVVTTSEVMTQFIDAVVPTTEAELWLRKQQLIQKNKPTVAGVLLFSDEPQAFLQSIVALKFIDIKQKI